MRKICILIVMGLVLTIKLEAKKIEGKIVLENDTIDVVFNIPVNFFTQEPNYEKLQNKVKYFDATGKKTSLRPDDAKEIQFKFEFENIRMVSRYNSLGLGNMFTTNSNIFLRIIIDGNLKLFMYYYTQRTPGMVSNAGSFGPSGGFTGTSSFMTGGAAYSVERCILQKGNGELKRPKGLTFKNDMVEYFSDCPSLVKKIESKDFRKDDLNFIVEFYNKNCK